MCKKFQTFPPIDKGKNNMQIAGAENVIFLQIYRIFVF